MQAFRWLTLLAVTLAAPLHVQAQDATPEGAGEDPIERRPETDVDEAEEPTGDEVDATQHDEAPSPSEEAPGTVAPGREPRAAEPNPPPSETAAAGGPAAAPPASYYTPAQPTADPEAIEAPATGATFSLGTEGARLTTTATVPLNAVTLAFSIAANDTDEDGSVDWIDFESGVANGLEAAVGVTGLILGGTDEGREELRAALCRPLGLLDPGPQCTNAAVERALIGCRDSPSSHDGCDDPTVRRYLEDGLESRGFLRARHWTILSVRAGVDFRRQDWRDPAADFADRSSEFYGPFAAIGLAAQLPGFSHSVLGSFEYRMQLKAPPTQAICEDVMLPPDSRAFACPDGQFTAPLSELERLRLRAEYRIAVHPHFGLGLRATFDASEAREDSETNVDDTSFRARNLDIDVGLFAYIDSVRVGLRPGIRVWTYDRTPASPVEFIGTLSLGAAFRLLP